MVFLPDVTQLASTTKHTTKRVPYSNHGNSICLLAIFLARVLAIGLDCRPERGLFQGAIPIVPFMTTRCAALSVSASIWRANLRSQLTLGQAEQAELYRLQNTLNVNRQNRVRPRN